LAIHERSLKNGDFPRTNGPARVLPRRKKSLGANFSALIAEDLKLDGHFKTKQAQPVACSWRCIENADDKARLDADATQRHED
jgi:hypothetical protein